MTDITWKDVEYGTSIIAQYYENRKYTAVVGLSRGGLIPGTILSHKLKVPFIPLTWQTRDFGAKDFDTISKLKAYVNNGDDFLIVDDIYDTGKTFREIREHLNCDFTTLVSKESFDGFSPMMFSSKEWINFPWE